MEKLAHLLLFHSSCSPFFFGDFQNQPTSWEACYRVYIRVSQPWHYRHSELGNSLWWGLSCALRMFSTIVSTPPNSILSCDNQKCLQTLPNVPWGGRQNCPWRRTTVIYHKSFTPNQWDCVSIIQFLSASIRVSLLNYSIEWSNSLVCLGLGWALEVPCPRWPRLVEAGLC